MGGRGGSSGIPRTRNFISISDMPKLTGSEKQIKWAESIRSKMVEEINLHISDSNEDRKKRGDPPLSDNSKTMRASKKLYEIEEAKWFIDNRKFIDKTYVLTTLTINGEQKLRIGPLLDALEKHKK